MPIAGHSPVLVPPVPVHVLCPNGFNVTSCGGGSAKRRVMALRSGAVMIRSGTASARQRVREKMRGGAAGAGACSE